MNWNKHSKLEGLHAILGASKHSWTNYDDDKIAASYKAFLATQRGTKLHEFAANCIKLGIRLPRSKKTLNMYVNDAIGFNMNAEQTLFYSDNAFGTADAIAFRDGLLRIHDLKTGVSPVSVRQLEIYDALFCLEYKFSPFDIFFENRIYQNDDVVIYESDQQLIRDIMDKIIRFDKIIEKLKAEE